MVPHPAHAAAVVAALGDQHPLSVLEWDCPGLGPLPIDPDPDFVAALRSLPDLLTNPSTCALQLGHTGVAELLASDDVKVRDWGLRCAAHLSDRTE